MTAAKTPNNEGSVYQRASDGKWCAAVTLPSGRRKVVYGEAEKEAIRERRKLLTDVEAAKPEPAGRTPTRAADLTRWLDVRIAGEVEAGHLDESTADSYRQMVEGHILLCSPLPAGQSKPVEGFTEADLEKVFIEMMTDDLATRWFSMLAFAPRRGEALAMRWSLTDLDASTTKLRKQLRRVRGEVGEKTGRAVIGWLRRFSRPTSLARR